MIEKILHIFQKQHILLVFFIIFLAGFFRIYRLDQVPPSPYWEEVALGYDAYSIRTTGKDHHGNSYPMIAFPSFGDYKPSGYFYAIVPFVRALGLNIWSVRLPSAIAGILSVGFVYLIGKELFGKNTAVISSFVFAISPWAIQFSRGGWEVNLSMTMILAGSWFLLLAKKKPQFLLLAAVFFGLSMYTYHAARLFAPIVGGVGGLAVLYGWFLEKNQNSKFKIQTFVLIHTKKLGVLFLSLIIAFIFVFPFIANVQNKEVSSRFSDTSIFSDISPILLSNAKKEEYGNSVFARLVYHRYRYFAQIIFSQWSSHFSPSFLFVRGDGNLRHWNGNTGELYPFDALFIIVSLLCILFFLYRKIQNPKSKLQNAQILLIVWIMVAAIAPSLVTPAPHALRFLYAAPAFSLLVAVGITQFSALLTKKHRLVFLFVVFVIYLFSCSRYFSLYMTAYPVQASADWQYGYEQLYSWIFLHKQANEQVYISRKLGRPAMYYLFYSHYDPSTLQAIEPTLPKDQLELLRIDDYHFTDNPPLDSSGIYAVLPGAVIEGGKIMTTILDQSDNAVWVIWRKIL